MKILADTPVPAKPDGRITIDAIRNEYESAQFVVTGREKIEIPAVSVGKLVGPSSIVPRVETNFLGFVPVRKGTTDTPPERPAADCAPMCLCSRPHTSPLQARQC